jgi:octaprenyl-diphosphate synthase
MQEFGILLGIAFQIKDDLLDYQINKLSGKPAGNDIQEKKLTLPLIHALQMSNLLERKSILHLMNSSDKGARKTKVILDFITRNNGFIYAEVKMNEYATRASDHLMQFPESPIRESLLNYIVYTINRNN